VLLRHTGEHLDIHTRKYGRFGLAFSKHFLLGKGANPIFYVARDSVDPLLASLRQGGFDEDAAKSLTPFQATRAATFDSMLPKLNQLLLPAPAEAGPPGKKARDETKLLHDFLTRYVFSLAKAFDGELPQEDPDNYYMEREWRVIGNVLFEISDVRIVFVPGAWVERFCADMPELRDRVYPLD
jgi:hypothetical protein